MFCYFLQDLTRGPDLTSPGKIYGGRDLSAGHKSPSHPWAFLLVYELLLQYDLKEIF